MSEYNLEVLKLPDEYLGSNAEPAYKELFEYYKKVMQESNTRSRKGVYTLGGWPVWEESLEEYKERLEKLDND